MTDLSNRPLILYVDDESPNRTVFDACFKNDFRLICVDSGPAALEAMKLEQPGVVVSDQRMPGMSGMELLERVKDTFPDTARIILTAHSDHEPILEAINRVQVTRYVVKPWDRRELHAILQGAIDSYQLVKQVRELELQIIDAQRSEALGKLAGGLVHDMASPLAAIAANAERLRYMDGLARELETRLKPDRPDDAEMIGELPEIARDLDLGAQYLATLVNGLRDYWRPRSASASDANPKVVLQFVKKLVDNRARHHKVTLTIDAPELPNVCIPAPELCQVVVNLVVNACQAFGENTMPRKVTVNARTSQGGVEITVADTGRGIPPSMLSQLGIKQLTTKPEGQGTGLGLLVCKSIVERAHGEFNLTSTENQGTVARVWLPLLRT